MALLNPEGNAISLILWLVIDFNTILKKSDGGPGKAVEAVIQTEQEWKTCVARCQSVTHTRLDAEAINFPEETVVAVAMGESHEAGVWGESQRAGVLSATRSGDQMSVGYTVIEADQQQEQLRSRVHIIRTWKASKVSFQKTKIAEGV